MNSDSSPSPPRNPRGRMPPHIRLNSGTSDVMFQESDSRPGTANGRPTSRSLIPPGHAPYGSSSDASASAAELLLPPRRTRPSRRFRDDIDTPSQSPTRSQSPNPFASRRNSWDSEGSSRDSRYGPFASPFDDSRSPSRAGSEDEGLNTQTVSEKYNILPSAGLLLFPEDVENDDALHNPGPDDDKLDRNIWTRRGLMNVGGLAALTLGLLAIFIGYPVATFMTKAIAPPQTPCSNNPMCVHADVKVPLLKNIRKGLIDPTTPDSVKERTAHDGSKQVLVFSDEFNTPGRTFYDQDDPYFQAMDLWYGVTQDLEWYDPDAVTTADGTLNIRFDAFQNHGLNYRSGMIQSWNKLCYKGGHLEASISLPGKGDTSGFWPGFWTMGNLGRAGYAATTDGMWPYSYDDICDAGITANQSQTDGLSYLPGMRLPACSCSGEDHPSPGRSRSAPEIDAIEASVGPINGMATGSASQSCQIAPFDVLWRPDTDFIEVYDDTVTSMNSYQGGVYQQAISGVTNLNNSWYDGKEYQKYSFEYKPGKNGWITWHVGDVETWTLDARAIGPNGNVGQRVIPVEPMYVIANFGMSGSFAFLNMTGLATTMPATMRIDYIRIYQDEDSKNMGCDPPGYPTTQYIAEHPGPYANANLTLWKQTGFDWPKNTLVNECKA